jgi:hypothetical protein
MKLEEVDRLEIRSVHFLNLKNFKKTLYEASVMGNW